MRRRSRADDRYKSTSEDDDDDDDDEDGGGAPVAGRLWCNECNKYLIIDDFSVRQQRAPMHERFCLRHTSASGFGKSFAQAPKLVVSDTDSDVNNASDAYSSDSGFVTDEEASEPSADNDSDDDDDDNVYVVDYITDHRVNRDDGSYEFFVHWRGYPSSDDSWVNEADCLDKRMLNDYWQRRAKSAPPTGDLLASPIVDSPLLADQSPTFEELKACERQLGERVRRQLHARQADELIVLDCDLPAAAAAAPAKQPRVVADSSEEELPPPAARHKRQRSGEQAPLVSRTKQPRVICDEADDQPPSDDLVLINDEDNQSIIEIVN